MDAGSIQLLARAPQPPLQQRAGQSRPLCYVLDAGQAGGRWAHLNIGAPFGIAAPSVIAEFLLDSLAGQMIAGLRGGANGGETMAEFLASFCSQVKLVDAGETIAEFLVSFCSQVKLVDAGFIWTEPHSMRLKVKLTVQGEVLNGAILQQV